MHPNSNFKIKKKPHRPIKVSASFFYLIKQLITRIDFLTDRSAFFRSQRVQAQVVLFGVIGQSSIEH